MTDTLDLDAIDADLDDAAQTWLSSEVPIGSESEIAGLIDLARDLVAEVRRLRAENAALQETEWEWGRICCDNCRVIEPHAGSARFATHRRRKAGPWIPAPEGTTDV